MALFSLSIFMLLLVLGFGRGDYSTDKNYGTFSGQAKIAKPGARVAGFRSVAPEPVPEKTFWDTVRDTTDGWFGGGNMASVGKSDASKSELQKLQSRSKRERMTTAISSM
ncbi:hypothetical protein BCF46_3264 [Litoreibacter meonggei]|uniref:Uncharacterized protein n=2 Tax=Litoreibacter meonggei TaxID=1049199 RepID=A0A497VP43_9RHOB|nr:hypothetical protein BCF46_3264 [Litoreibacter meonggei]